VGAAIAVLERGLSLTRTTELPVMLTYYLASLGHAYVVAGRTEEGLALLEESVTPQIFGKSF
jgi:hypothetical protein